MQGLVCVRKYICTSHLNVLHQDNLDVDKVIAAVESAKKPLSLRIDSNESVHKSERFIRESDVTLALLRWY